ncbi:helix-turn-helix domain-containing protein [Photobacterium sp. R1]
MPMTQELIANMLGVRRESVTKAAISPFDQQKYAAATLTH